MPVCIKRRRKINPSRAEFLFKAANDVSKIVKRVRSFDFPIRAHFCKYVLLERRVLHDFVFFMLGTKMTRPEVRTPVSARVDEICITTQSTTLFFP